MTIHLPLRDVVRALTTELDAWRPGASSRATWRRASASRARASRSPGSIRMPARTARSARKIATSWRRRSTQLQAEGIDAIGPLPADTLFHERARASYDVALCMYHDQALIPIKTLAFDRAVNVTLGLPFVRTSPDHGTAFDIAGSGRADPSSLVAALALAARLAAASAGACRRKVMAQIDDLPPLRDVIRRHGLSAKKSLGQNFLLDLNLTARIARAGEPLDGRDRDRGRPRTGRPDARAAGGGRTSA